MEYNLENSLDRKKAKVYFDKLMSGSGIIEIKKKQAKRSVSQNAYVHVCFTLFGIEYGLTIAESKTLLKRNCSFMVYDKKGEKFLRSTSDLDKYEMTNFIDWIRNFAADHGCYIPTPEEYIENRVEIDREIKMNQTHT
jgi:hypothetical protein